MGIYIKEAEMPKRCYDCYLETVAECDLWSEIDEMVTRHPHCPLVDIPTPHGRLIDEDDLVNRILPDPVAEMGCPDPEGAEQFCMWLDMAETVIEEER